jgi:hypothetical protein
VGFWGVGFYTSLFDDDEDEDGKSDNTETLSR